MRKRSYLPEMQSSYGAEKFVWNMLRRKNPKSGRRARWERLSAKEQGDARTYWDALSLVYSMRKY